MKVAEPSSSQPGQLPPKASISKFGKMFARSSGSKHKSKLQKEMDQDKQGAMVLQPDSLTYHGCTLLSNFQRHHLREQERSSNDALHWEFVQDLSEGKQIDVNRVLQYKKLSKQDITTNPDDWKYAPILVSTNVEQQIHC